jgi:tetratricopeptide (TPR) repeat protein
MSSSPICTVSSYIYTPSSKNPRYWGRAESLDRMPLLVTDCIASYLDRDEVRNLAEFSPSMKDRMLSYVDRTEFEKISRFVEDLLQNLDISRADQQDHKKSLEAISSNFSSQAFHSFEEIEEAVSSAREQFVNILKTWDEQKVNGLEDHLDLPDSFEDIFNLLAFERQIDEANLISNERVKGNTLRDISKVLASRGYFEKAIAVVEEISDEIFKSDVLRDIPKALTEAGKFAQATAVAKEIPNRWAKSHALQDISKALRKQGKLDDALSVAEEISDERVKATELRAICNILIQEGKLDQAIKTAKSMKPDGSGKYYGMPVSKNRVLKAISRALTEAGKFDQATKIAELISWNRKREDASGY